MRELDSLKKELERLESELVVAQAVAEGDKLKLNGSFGKFGSAYSTLYSPDLMLQTTITGQLALLMQIEALELSGIPVISANTDGVVSRVPRVLLDRYHAIYAEWESATGFETEETEYVSLHSRDINNYFAVKDSKGKKSVKTKGAFAPAGPGLPGASGQKKNPNLEIAVEAVVDYLTLGTPIEETVEWCDDIRKFITVRRVKGGAEQDGEYVGKVIRWYYAKGNRPAFSYVENGNSVPMSIGAKPCMVLPDEFPSDVDFDYYIREAYAILQDIGMGTTDPKLKGRTGTMLARLPDQKSLHIVDASTGIAICGKTRASIRDSWVEHDEPTAENKLCSKCKKANEL